MTVFLNSHTLSNSPPLTSSPSTPLQEKPSPKKRYISPLHDKLHTIKQRALQKTIFLYKGTVQTGHEPLSGAHPLDTVYFCEVLDSSHRYGQKLRPFFTKWKESKTSDDFTTWLNKIDRLIPFFTKWKESKTSDDFTSWLNKLDKKPDITDQQQLIQDVFLKMDTASLTGPGIEFFDQKKLADCELQVDKNGRLFTKESKGQPLESYKGLEKGAEPNRFGFVIAPGKQHKIYAALLPRESRSHASFLCGGPVISSGTFFCNNGVITEFINRSGHYKPTKEMAFAAVQAFLDQGIDLSEAQITMFGSAEKILGSKYMEEHKITRKGK